MNSPFALFYLRYFAATQRISFAWMFRLSPHRQVKMLAELMQWEITMQQDEEGSRR